MIFTREQLPCVEVANNLTALNSQVLVMMSGIRPCWKAGAQAVYSKLPPP